MRQGMWARIGKVNLKTRSHHRRIVKIVTNGAEETKEMEELIERWKSGEPMERFGGVYDEERSQLMWIVVVQPGDV